MNYAWHTLHTLFGRCVNKSECASARQLVWTAPATPVIELGVEIAQLYVRDDYSSVTRQAKELKGFVRVPLNPGETTTVNFAITAEMLSMLDCRLKRVVEPGTFTKMLGGSSDDGCTDVGLHKAKYSGL